jgi:hypothetical protein
MLANTTTPTSSPVDRWLQRVLTTVRHIAGGKPECSAQPHPLTRRQILLMEQDRKRAEAKARCAELARQAKHNRQHA